VSHEFQRFLKTWDEEALRTLALLRTIPDDQYDFRPDPKGRSMGEMAWHLAELDAYIPHGVARRDLSIRDRPEGIERPRVVAELPPGYERVHRAAVEKLRAVGDLDFEASVKFFDGNPMPVRRILWNALIHHMIHHRGQLALLIRLAGGRPTGLYGPTREEMEAMRARA
jgi:uncharacterized damage-inducible protein DinB